MKGKFSKDSAFELIFGGVFFFVGTCLLAGGIVSYVLHQNFRQIATEVQAVIADIQTHVGMDGDMEHDVWVTYEREGREYTEEINFYSSSMYKGKEITVLVDMNNPNRVRSVRGNIFLISILSGLGIVFATVGGVVLLIPVFRSARKKKAIAAGYYVYATVTGGKLNTHIAINNQNPYRLECEYTDVFSGVTHKFSSDYIWEDPEVYVGREVKVYCNRDFSGYYYVDVDSLRTYM